MKVMFCVWMLEVLLMIRVFTTVNASFKSSRGTRMKRYLVFPEGEEPAETEFEFHCGLGLPVEIEGLGELDLDTELQVTFELPTNGSELLEGYVTSARRSLQLPDRWTMYSVLENVITRFGLDGHACVLRTICETAASATVKELGVSAELLHVMFTPSSTDEVSNDLWQREYVSAEHVGNKRETACAYFYPECSVSLLDLISKSNLTSSTVETKD